MERIARTTVTARVHPEFKARLPELASAAGMKNPSRYVEMLIRQAVERAMAERSEMAT
jgi:predicted transcriptional regulator